MKKHFLLLVMALMSMSAWAVTNMANLTIRVGNVVYGDGSNPNIAVYDNDGPGPLTLKDADHPNGHYTWDGYFYTTETGNETVTRANLVTGTTYWVRVVGVSANGYEGTLAGSFIQNKKPVTISLQQGYTLSKTFGEEDPALDLTKIAYDGLVNNEQAADVFSGTLSYSHESENVGQDPVTFTGLTSTNYEVAYDGNTKITINAKAITDAMFGTAANAKVSSVVYKGVNVDPEFTIKDGDKTLVAGTDYEFVYAANVDRKNATAANAPIAVTVKGKGNYTTATANNPDAGIECQLIITKAPMSVAIANIHLPYRASAYGIWDFEENQQQVHINDIQNEIDALVAANKSPFTYFGFVGDDVAESTLTGLVAPTVTAVAENLNAGTYDLTYSQATSNNYEITQITTEELGGKFVIDPFKISVLAEGKTKKVGEKDPDLTYSVIPAEEGWNNVPRQDVTPQGATTQVLEPMISTEPVLTRQEGETVGNWGILFTSDAVPTANYEIKNHIGATLNDKGEYQEGPCLAISASTLTLTILNKTKNYGEADSKVIDWDAPVAGTDYIVSGLMAGDAITGIKLQREDGETVGNYSITLKDEASLDENKYEGITVIPGNFAIKPAPLAIVISDQTMKVGQTAADIDKTKVTISGLKKGDTIDDVLVLAFANGVETQANADNVPALSAANTYNTGITYDYPLVVNAQQVAVATKNPNYLYPEDQLDENEQNMPKASGKLIVINAAQTLLLNRVAKADYADATKNDAAAEIAKAAAACKPATYYTADEAAAYNQENNLQEGDDGYKYEGSEKEPAVVYNVTFSDFEMIAEKWYPLVLPFETSAQDISGAFGYAVVNVLNTKNTDASKVSFKLHMGKIAANTPFVVKVYDAYAEGNANVNMNSRTFWGKTIVAPKDYEAVTTDDAKDESGITFIGTYKGKTDGFRSNEWYFSASADYNQYYPGNDTNQTYLRPLGAYLQATTAGARIFEFEEADGTVTAISSVAFENGISKAEGWYTIGGVKLQGAPSQKGIYINNGKKVVIK